MENDNEVKGVGNSLDFGARIYDTRLGRWISVDPLIKKYPDLSPYNFVAGNPITSVDPDGKEIFLYHIKNINSSDGKYVHTANEVSDKTNRALKAILSTSEGLEFIGQFAKANQTIGGHTFKENGILSNHDLVIADYSFEDFDGGSNIPIKDAGYISSRINPERNNVTVNVVLYTRGFSESDVAETAAHEFFLHGYKAKSEVETFKNGGRVAFDKYKLIDPNGHLDHQAEITKDHKHEGFKKYNNVRNKL
ncbi:MAG: hypothetical protein IPP46_02145 [Bacteroidetes bacterium]|nr:hypothetical protein [Bacteroidota bacterium]